MLGAYNIDYILYCLWYANKLL